MKISNFFFNYLSFPLLPNSSLTLRFLSFVLRFRIFHNTFREYLQICINKKENRKVIFAVNKFLYVRNLPLSIFEIYLSALRNLELNKDCVENSLKIINSFPDSDIGYWHIIHAYISQGKITKARNILERFNKTPIKSVRVSNLCFGNKIMNQLFSSTKIDTKSKFFHLFFSDSGLIGQSLLKVNFHKIKKESNFVIFISSHAGFSNTITALLNTIGLAKLLNINEIFIVRSSLTTSLYLQNLNIEDIKIKTVKCLPSQNHISGNFFSHYEFIKLQNPKFPLQRLDYASSMLKNYAIKNYQSNSEVIIHIRSGDIFNSRTVHKSYGQPPLAFYILSIRNIKPSSITLIFEDYANPVIKLLISFIKSINCNLKISNSNDLREDISCILKAKCCIFGNGTFVPGILLGSKSIKKIYSFELANESKIKWSLYRIEEIVNVTDKLGIYRKKILDNNWKASNSQLKLMSNYSINNLKLNLFKSL